MALTDKTRNQIKELIYETYSKMDPSGVNTDHYKKMFNNMTDVEFDKYINSILDDPNEYFTFHTVDYENTLQMKNIQAAANVLNVPLFEYVAMPYLDGNKENPITTRYPVPVGYLHIKGMQQIRQKKNNSPTEILKRSALTNQVTGEDKGGRETDQENYVLLALGAKHALREFMGPRADDNVMKLEMYNNIAKNGFVSLDDLPDKLENKTTLNLVDMYFKSMGFETDLVTDNIDD